MSNTDEYIPSSLRRDKLPSNIEYTRTMYAIGEEHLPDEFGMWDGPNRSEHAMLEVEGRSDKSCIVRFKDNPNYPRMEPLTDIIWRWRKDRWIKTDEYKKED